MARSDTPDEIADRLGLLYTPAEVSKLFNVSPKTITRWATTGVVPCITLAGGHRRFPKFLIDGLVTGTVTAETALSEISLALVVQLKFGGDIEAARAALDHIAEVPQIRAPQELPAP